MFLLLYGAPFYLLVISKGTHIMKKEGIAAFVFAVLAGFSAVCQADARVFCGGELSRVMVNRGQLMATISGYHDTALCLITKEYNYSMPSNALDISTAECQAWHATLLTAISSGKKVTIGYYLPSTKSCQEFSYSEYWRAEQVYINRQ